MSTLLDLDIRRRNAEGLLRDALAENQRLRHTIIAEAHALRIAIEETQTPARRMELIEASIARLEAAGASR